MLTITREFCDLFIVMTWLGICTLSRINRIKKYYMMCTSEICISLKAPRGLPIQRLEVKYLFFVHPNINKTNRIKENNTFLKKIFAKVLTYFVTGPGRYHKQKFVQDQYQLSNSIQSRLLWSTLCLIMSQHLNSQR